MPQRDDFYAQLPAVERFVDVCEPSRYHAVPDNWWLVITDVRGSTRAIEAGRYKDVNALGVASIVAVRNALDGFEIPFVFGGDGATLLIPDAVRLRVEPALRGLQRASRDGFGLDMRVGMVRVGELRAAGHDVRVTRFQVSDHIALAMLSGSGLTEGEAWIKDPVQGLRYALGDGPADVSFEGFECRWQPLKSQAGEVIALLVQARSNDTSQAARVYTRVIDELEAILEGKEGRPAQLTNLKLASAAKTFNAEATLKTRQGRGAAFLRQRIKTQAMTQLGRLLMATGLNASGFDGKAYRSEVAANTDFRKFDDTLRMVLDMSTHQRKRLEAWLQAAYERHELCYGIHISDAALMTCVIDSYAGDHVHFIDAAHGGYAMAAKQLKTQLKGAAK